jgi:hypothetical protein
MDAEGVIRLESIYVLIALEIAGADEELPAHLFHLENIKKYLPTLRSKSKLKTEHLKKMRVFADGFMKFFEMNEREYREFKSSGISHKFQRDICQKKFDELKNNWPEIVKFTTGRHKDGRPHHHISYTKLFKQKLVLKEGVSLEPKINNYNMILKKSKMNTINLENVYPTHQHFYEDLISEINKTNNNMFGDIYKIKFNDKNGNSIFVTNNELNLFIVDLPIIHEDENEICVEYNVNKII